MKPNSFWMAWYECRPAVVQISPCGKYFYSLGQDAAWGLSNAEFIKEIDLWNDFGFTLTENGDILKRIRHPDKALFV